MSLHVSLPAIDRLGTSFVRFSREKISDEYFPKIERAVRTLGPDDVWWKPNANTLSIGNLMLHLAGNIRQWIIHGIGGAQDVRNRPLEFAPESQPDLGTMLEALRATVTEACDLLRRLEVNPDCEKILAETRVPQNIEETVLSVIYHVTEHMSYHTGEIVYITKARTGKDMNFYDL